MAKKKEELKGKRVEVGMVQFAEVPPTIEFNGFIYERLDRPTAELELDVSNFDEETKQKINTMMDNYGFVSQAECIRHIIREMMLRGEALPKAKKAKKAKK